MSAIVEKMIVTDDEENWPQLRAKLDEAMLSTNKGDWETAISACRSAIDIFPHNPEPYFVLSIVAFLCRNEAQALKMAETAHGLDPETREYADVLAVMSARVGNLTDGVYYAKIAEACTPHPYLRAIVPTDFMDFQSAMKHAAPSRHNVEGQRAFNEANYLIALKEFTAEIGLHPDNVDALLYMARTTLVLGHSHQAIGAAQSVIHHEPDNAMARALLARALAHIGREGEAIVVAKEAIAMSDADAEVYLSAMEALQRCPSFPRQGLKDIAAAFRLRFAENAAVSDAELVESAEGAPIHLGFISNAFFRNPVFDYAVNWFSAKKSKDTKVSAYQYSMARDAVMTAVRGATDDVRSIFGIDPYTLSITLAAENLDVMVDVSQIDGDTCGTVLGLSQAPVRVGATVLPEPGLMPGVTHVLTDETMAQADREMLLEGQDLIVVPGTLFARRPIASLQQDTPTPMIENGYPTFAAMATLPALSPETAIMFGRLLRAIDGAKLMLFGAQTLSNDARTRVRELFMHAGVLDRILFAEGAAETNEEDTGSAMQRLEVAVPTTHWRAVDVFLDTYPVNGRREITEALWSGVPVVTRSGPRRASSVGASIIAAAGRPNWIARSADSFVEIASGLVADVDALARQRATLQDVIAKSSLFDTRKTADAIRHALIEAGRKARRSAG